MKEEVLKILESTTAAAPEMTHNLNVFGGGDMGEGIRRLWTEGQHSGTCTGLVVGSIIWGGGIIIYQVLKHVPRKLESIKTTGQAYNDGYIKGKEEALSSEINP